MPHSPGHTANAEMTRCIDNCHACSTSCNSTVAHCLEKGGKHASPEHIALLVDCAAICETAAASMGRNSSAHMDICRACAEVCRACEQSCRSMGDDKIMKQCADICAKCAESCERMAA